MYPSKWMARKFPIALSPYLLLNLSQPLIPLLRVCLFFHFYFIFLLLCILFPFLGEGVTKLITRKPTNFLIHAVDKNGQPIKEGGDEFVVTVSGAASVPAKVRDNRDGTYTVRYVPPESGEYKVQVQLYGKEDIRGSPFKVFSERGNLDRKSVV